MNKLSEVTGSFAFSASFNSLLLMVNSNSNPQESLIYFTAGNIIATPIIYFGLQKLKKKLDTSSKREQHQLYHIANMLHEMANGPHEVDEKTSLFLDNIMSIAEEEDFPIPEDELMHINQFLYLINANYYDRIAQEITEEVPNLTREKLVNLLIKLYVKHCARTNETKFDEKTAQELLSSCFIIPKGLGKEIYKEFKDSKRTFDGTTDYLIISKVIEHNEEEYIAKLITPPKTRTSFDYHDWRFYRDIVASIEDSDYFIENDLGDPHGLAWDYHTLQGIVSTILDNHKEDIPPDEEADPAFSLVCSYIYDAMIYATVNNRHEVGRQELLNTFKNWTYLPFELRLDILDEYMVENHIDYSHHPFQISGPRKKAPFQKVITYNFNKNKS